MVGDAGRGLYASGTGITVVYGICQFCHIGQHQYVTGRFVYVRGQIFHIGRFVYAIGVVKVQLYAIGHEFSSYTKMVIIVYASLHMPFARTLSLTHFLACHVPDRAPFSLQTPVERSERLAGGWAVRAPFLSVRVRL